MPWDHLEARTWSLKNNFIIALPTDAATEVLMSSMTLSTTISFSLFINDENIF